MKKIFILGVPEKWVNYSDAVSGAGAEPVFSENIADAECCDALLLTGGGDINPALFGQENMGSKDIDDKRDEAEYALLKMFHNAGKPVLGICRGHQVITTFFGGTLIQDLPGGIKETHQWSGSDVYNTHMVTAQKGSYLEKIYGARFMVNTAHHQSSDVIPEGFHIIAQSDDGMIEAIINEEKKIYGIQWHPEKMSFKNLRPDTVDGRFIFEYFLSKI